MSEIKRIDPISAGNVMGLMYVIIGFAVGLFTSLGVLMGASAQSYVFSLMFSLIGFPILYGIMGFVAGLIGSFLYNVVASKIGGIKVDISKR